MNFIGIDVSKKKLDCSLIRAERPDARLHKVVPNTPEGVATLLNWVKDKAKCDDIGAFASTGSAQVTQSSKPPAPTTKSLPKPYSTPRARSPWSIRPTPRVSPKVLA